MPKVRITHDAEWFDASISAWLEKGDLAGAIDVITRDGQPETLLAVVRSYSDFDVWYCNGKTYTKYQTAFAALGAAIDRMNPEHRPLNDQWIE